MLLTLYQFPISHYCEKVRWALDYKGLDYKLKNLIPGLHFKTTTKLAAKSSVPVLQHGDKIIQGSIQIITYLDEKFPDKKLTPANPQEKQTALEWERYLDSELGIHVRRYLYQTVLQHRRLTIGFFGSGNSVFAKPILWFIYPGMVKKMRKYMDINPSTAEQSRVQIQKCLRRLNESVRDKKFLVGDQFCRADLTACALLAPLFMPSKYGLQWPQALPEPLHSEINAMNADLAWAIKTYTKYR